MRKSSGMINDFPYYVKIFLSFARLLRNPILRQKPVTIWKGGLSHSGSLGPARQAPSIPRRFHIENHVGSIKMYRNIMMKGPGITSTTCFRKRTRADEPFFCYLKTGTSYCRVVPKGIDGGVRLEKDGGFERDITIDNPHHSGYF